MTTSPAMHETALLREQKLFRELFSRLIDTILNGMFDLRPEKAARRSKYLAVFFILSGFLISIIYYPLSKWASHIGNVLSSTLSTSSSPEQFNAAFTAFASFLQEVITDPRILQYLPVFLASFFIALQSAAIYLADVFELEDISVARRFINAVALSGSDETIRVKHGEVSDQHQESPTYLIGGPGKVLVELDSVALFERADGTPHVIGPTGNKPSGKETLEGFERFRQALDIRDHHITLRDQDERSKAVFSRSRDGVPVKATDVRLMFSVFRGEKPEASAENPYPYDKKAIEHIVYKAASRVTPELQNPSTFDFNWINNMIGLIHGRLTNFMSEHNLSEYLASIGLPEIEKVKLREKKISQQMQEITRADDEPLEHKDSKPLPNFQGRSKVKDLFAQFTEGFSNQARNNGVELQWIGVGTWESPVDIVPDKHLEAWMQTQENIRADSPKAMEAIEKTEIAGKMKELILKVPINAYDEIVYATKYPPKKTQKQLPKKTISNDDGIILSDGELIPTQGINPVVEFLKRIQNEGREEDDEATGYETQSLLEEYKNLLHETVAFIRDKNEPEPQVILDAIRHIDNQIAQAHWVGQ